MPNEARSEATSDYRIYYWHAGQRVRADEEDEWKLHSVWRNLTLQEAHEEFWRSQKVMAKDLVGLKMRLCEGAFQRPIMELEDESLKLRLAS